MGIFDGLKKMIFAQTAGPVEQVATPTAPLPNRAQSSSAGSKESRFSESDILAVQQRAEIVHQAFNESLIIANESNNRGIREYRLCAARERLIELKTLANKFPFLHLTNLEAVEACVLALEAETRSLPYHEVVDVRIKSVSGIAHRESMALREGKGVASPVTSGEERQHCSSSDEQAIRASIQSFFKVINESIEIARKSKNLDTKLSRLDVARHRLQEAKVQARRYSLVIDGFDEAEAEINRIDEAIKIGTPTEIAGMPQIEENIASLSEARNLLKEATALKREKKYVEACDRLREAYRADGAENLMIEDRLRLPMYLQLAGRADEGWDEINRLNVTNADVFSQARIAAQMATFLRKEGKYKNAALFAAWTLCKQKEANIDTYTSMVRLADQEPAHNSEREALGLPPWPQTMPVTGTTPSGNPIYEVGYPTVHRCLTEDYDRTAVRARLERDLAKVVAKEIISAVATDLSRYLRTPPPYNCEAVNLILAKHLD